MTKVYLMTSEHFRVPGLIIRICATRELAVKEAMACANIMLADAGKKTVTTEDEMHAAMKLLASEQYEACYADISEHEMIE